MEDKKPEAITEPKSKETSKEHIAKAKAQNLSISTKHCIEMCSLLRYKTTAQAKRILEEVIELKRAVPFKRFKRDVGHKPGMAAGRYPQKAAKDVLKLVNSVEANAQNKGLNTASLKIIKMLANRAAVPVTGGRRRTGTKRTHLEIEVKETVVKKKEKEAVKKEETVSEKKEETKTESVKEEIKKPEVKTEVKKETPKVEEKKPELKVQKQEEKKEIPEKVPSAHELVKEVKEKLQTQTESKSEEKKNEN